MHWSAKKNHEQRTAISEQQEAKMSCARPVLSITQRSVCIKSETDRSEWRSAKYQAHPSIEKLESSVEKRSTIGMSKKSLFTGINSLWLRKKVPNFEFFMRKKVPEFLAGFIPEDNLKVGTLFLKTIWNFGVSSRRVGSFFLLILETIIFFCQGLSSWERPWGRKSYG